MKRHWRKILGYGAFTLCAYLFFLLATLPAQVAVAWIGKRYPLPVMLAEVQGSVWQGRAAGRVRDITLDQLQWTIHPWALALGRVEGRVELRQGEDRASAVVARHLDGDLTLRDLNASLSAATWEPRVNPRPIGLRGEIVLDDMQMTIAEGRLAEIRGVVSIRHAGLAPPLDIEVGDFRLALETDETKGIQGRLNDTGGPLQATGLLSLRSDGNYQLTAELASRDPNRKDLRQALQYLGPVDPLGKVQVRRAGTLPLRWP